jgi:terminase small subunit-like protein
MAGQPKLNALGAAIEMLGGMDYVFGEILEGVSMKRIGRELGVSRELIMAWIKQEPVRYQAYLALREVIAESKLELILELAEEEPDRHPMFGTVDSAWVAHRKNRIDVEKWSMRFDNRRRFHDGDGAPAVNVNLVLDNLVRMVKSRSMKLVGDGQDHVGRTLTSIVEQKILRNVDE